MSMAPRNPFEQPPPDPRFGDDLSRQGSNVWLWVLAAVGAMFLIGTVVCCGLGYMLVNAGKDFIAEEAAKKLQDNPVINEQIGEIEEIEMNFSELVAAAKEQDEDDDTVTFVFEVRGDKGSGKIFLRESDSSDDIKSAELVMDDGTHYEIPLDSFDEDREELDNELREAEIEPSPIDPVDSDTLPKETIEAPAS